MTDGYVQLLQRCQTADVNIDRVRQKLSGTVGVNPGDQIRFSVKLLEKMIADTSTREPRLETMVVTLKTVHVQHDGTKVLILEIPGGRTGATAYRLDHKEGRLGMGPFLGAIGA